MRLALDVEEVGFQDVRGSFCCAVSRLKFSELLLLEDVYRDESCSVRLCTLEPGRFHVGFGAPMRFS